jgi:two-component system sensor histidine kinase CiaH
MIKRLKIKFIILSMTSLFALLLIIVTGMNLINYRSVVTDADGVLALLSRNRGIFPDSGKDKGDRLPPNMSPELQHESRYFSVLLDESGNVVRADTSQIAAVDLASAIEYAKEVLQSNQDRGFIDDYRFLRSAEENTVRVIFLDCGRKMDSFYNFLLASAGMALAGFIIVFFVIAFFAERIIRPIAESYEKQKRFITDAGHEIKTPLTVINANVDVLEMEIGPNQWLEDIHQQSKRLTTLTNELVYLAKMEESEKSLQMIEFPVSEVVEESASAFKTPAKAQNKDFTFSIDPMLSMKGNTQAIRQLVSILMDNALKYSPAGGTIALTLRKQNRSIVLTVWNTTEIPVNGDNLKYVFDRFYRTDLSRNSETGGHGIGLSIAKAIVTSHNGKIHASTQDGHSFQITATFPL